MTDQESLVPRSNLALILPSTTTAAATAAAATTALAVVTVASPLLLPATAVGAQPREPHLNQKL